MSTLRGVCAVVGCGPGLGSSVARKFAREGYAVAALSRTEESFLPLRPQLEELGAKFGFFAVDVVDAASVKAAFAKVKEELGPVTVMVYNCGGGGFGIEPLSIDPAAFRHSFDVSCTGALLCSQAVLPDMLASEGGDASTAATATGTAAKPHDQFKKTGTLLFSSATSAFRSTANTAQFACGKFALRALSQALAKAYAKNGVHACHIRLDAVLDVPQTVAKHPEMYKAGKLADTDQIAETYYAVHQQSLMALSNEIDLRPFQEGWTC